MAMSSGSWLGAIAFVLAGATISATLADERVVDAMVPAHTEWCSKSKFDESLFRSPVGQDSVMTEGAARILDAALTAGAKSIGHVYIRAFQADEKQVEATFCAVVPPTLRTDDASIAVAEVGEAQFLGAVCTDPDECMTSITAVLANKPYDLTQRQIDMLDWKYAPASKLDSTADAIAAGLVETDSTPIAQETHADQAEHPFTIVAVAKPPKGIPAKP